MDARIVEVVALGEGSSEDRTGYQKADEKCCDYLLKLLFIGSGLLSTMSLQHLDFSLKLKIRLPCLCYAVLSSYTVSILGDRLWIKYLIS